MDPEGRSETENIVIELVLSKCRLCFRHHGVVQKDMIGYEITTSVGSCTVSLSPRGVKYLAKFRYVNKYYWPDQYATVDKLTIRKLRWFGQNPASINMKMFIVNYVSLETLRAVM